MDYESYLFVASINFTVAFFMFLGYGLAVEYGADHFVGLVFGFVAGTILNFINAYLLFD